MLYSVQASRHRSSSRVSRRARLLLDRAAEMARNRVVLEPLEDRLMLSATLSGKTLTVNGTGGTDNIVVEMQPGSTTNLLVNVDGAAQTFPIKGISQIVINGEDSNDYLAIVGSVAIKATINAGSGNDTLVGSTYGHDTLIGGAGSDSLTTSGKSNTLEAGTGSDTLDGGSSDTIKLGIGQDLVSQNNGASYALKTSTKEAALPTVAGATTTSFTTDDIVQPTGVINPISTVGRNDVSTIEQAYDFLDPVDSSENGAGQIIAIVDVYSNPGTQIFSDLNTFTQATNEDTLEGNPLPAPTAQTFTTVIATQNGLAPTNLPLATIQDWGTETDLDVEWAHAMAPDAHIVLFQAASPLVSDLMFAVNQAAQYVSANGGGVVSMSFGGGEFQQQIVYDDAVFGNAAYANVSFIAAAGDTPGEVSYPATSDYVTSVGGTTLYPSQVPFSLSMDGLTEIASEAYAEFAWTGNSNPANGEVLGGGGGVSAIEPTPTYQQDTVLDAFPVDSQGLIYLPTPTNDGIPGKPITMRSGADVAMIADPLFGVSVYDSQPVGGSSGWEEVGGTSLATPIFAAVVALANQQREVNGLGVIGTDLNPAIYEINNNLYDEPDPVSTVSPKWQDNGERNQFNPNSNLPSEPGEFYDIGGAGTTPGPGPAPTQGRLSAQGFDLSTGWGSPNVNLLVPTASDANDDFDINGEFLQLNLTNISTDGLGQPVYIPVQNPTLGGSASANTTVNLKASAQEYIDHSTPPSGSGSANNSIGVDSFIGTGTATVTLGAATTLTYELNMLDSTGNVLDITSGTIVLTPVSTSKYTYAMAVTFATGPYTGDQFWVSGTVSFGKNGGVSTSGTGYRIQGVNGNGKPINWGINGPSGGGGDLIWNFGT